jgi:hypothetical protein
MNVTTMSTKQPMQAGAPTLPLSPHLMAVWGAFLHEGLMLNSKNGGRASAILELWGQGCVELIMAVCDFIPDIWKQVQPYWYGTQDFPGVFEYEVVSIFGEQLGNYILKHPSMKPALRSERGMPHQLPCHARHILVCKHRHSISNSVYSLAANRGFKLQQDPVVAIFTGIFIRPILAWSTDSMKALRN